MSSLTLKNIPEELLRDLRESAQRDRRSLTQEIIHLLETALRDRRPTAPEPNVAAQVNAWRKLAGKWESDVDEATEVKQLRKARTKGRAVDL